MKWPPWKAVRDVLLFIGGLAGIAYETLAGEEPREALLVIFAAMAGLPAFLRTDEQKKGGDDVDKPGPAVTDQDRRVADALVEMLKDAAKAVVVPARLIRDYPYSTTWTTVSAMLAMTLAVAR